MLWKVVLGLIPNDVSSSGEGEGAGTGTPDLSVITWYGPAGFDLLGFDEGSCGPGTNDYAPIIQPSRFSCPPGMVVRHGNRGGGKGKWRLAECFKGISNVLIHPLILCTVYS